MICCEDCRGKDMNPSYLLARPQKKLRPCNPSTSHPCLHNIVFTVIVWKQEAVTEEYLNERSHYRETGIKTKRYMRGKFVPRDILNDPPLDKDGNYRSVFLAVLRIRIWFGSWFLNKLNCYKNSNVLLIKLPYMFLKKGLWRTIPSKKKAWFLFFIILHSAIFSLFWILIRMQHNLYLAVSNGEVELHSVVPLLGKAWPFSLHNFVLRENYAEEDKVLWFISTKKINRYGKQLLFGTIVQCGI